MLPTITQALFAFAFVLTPLTTIVQAGDICPGYNYAIWHDGPLNGLRQFGVVGYDCGKTGEGATCPRGNPCTCSSITCNSDQSDITGFISHENLWYACRPDVRVGTCDFFNNQPGYAIVKCCRNDGRKNKERGVINDEQFEAINATNAMLDRHIEEYESALKKRGRGGVKSVRERQKREMNDAMKREIDAGSKAWN